MSRRKSQEEPSEVSSDSSAAPEAPSSEPAATPDSGPAPAPAPPRPPEPDYKDLYLRALAELDNYRKVALRERRALIESAAEAVIRKLIDPVDALDRAVADVERLETQVAAELKPALNRSAEGLRALRRQFHAVFESEGVVRLWQPGASFNPAIHEAIASVPTDAAQEGTVVEVIQPGYLLRERLVRPARVAVAARKPAAAELEPAPKEDNHESHPSKEEE